MHRISDDDPMIVFNGVSKSFRIRHAHSFKQTIMALLGRQQLSDEFTAIHDLTFAVRPGEAVAVMGRNGSGKSTTLKLLSGVLRPSAGWIRVRGRIAGLLEVGAGFHPDLTGRENVYLNASILGMSKAETDARIDDIIAFAEIGEFIDTEVKRYSSGMYARLGFAVAIHTELDVLLVDEVLSVGDSEFRAKCNARLKELQAQGKTMFIVSHSAGQVKQLCTRGIVLAHGRKVYDGPIDGALQLIAPKKTNQRNSAAKKAAAKKSLVPAIPTITGSNSVGSVVAVATGDWVPTPLSFRFQWLRDDEEIDGSTTTTYNLTSADIGKSISVRVRGQRAGYVPLEQTSMPIVVESSDTAAMLSAAQAPLHHVQHSARNLST